MHRSTPPRTGLEGDVWLFFALACLITWLMDLPLALAWTRRLPPAPYALPLAGLGALGPTLAAALIAARRRELGAVFGRWRTHPAWVVLALLVPGALHLPATVLEVVLGGHPAQWFYPPVKPEHVAALVMFSVGEELRLHRGAPEGREQAQFGWRGFAHPRLARRFGPVIGSLLLGAVWGLWHLGMLFTPDQGAPSPVTLVVYMAELAVFSVVIAAVFERGGRSMAIAIALHAGGHLDNVHRAPPTEVRLRVLRFVVVLIAATLCARSLARDRAAGERGRG